MVFSNIIKDKNLRVLGGLSLLLLLLAMMIFYVQLGSITTPLIIHFEAYKGIDLLGGRFEVFSILLSALIINLINLLLADFIYKRERFMSNVFIFVNLEIAVLILITIGVIISVN